MPTKFRIFVHFDGACLQGILAPLLASVSLFGFYLLIKYLPELNIQIFL